MTTDGKTEWIDVDGQPGMQAKFVRDARTGRMIVCGLHIERRAITGDMLRRIPLGRIEAMANLGDESEPLDELPPLVRDTAQDDPDAFSRLVARHYRAWARDTPYPAARMSAAAGVPSATAHSWIYRARLRGFLPPGNRGKAG